MCYQHWNVRALAGSAIAIVFVCASFHEVWGRTPDYSEYQIKAAFLYKFAKLCEWPNKSDTEHIVIAILGSDPFGQSIDSILNGKVIHNRPINIRRLRLIDEIDSCDVLFISSSEEHQLEDLFKALHKKPILTVGDTKGIAGRGAIIGFVMVNC